MNDDMAIHTECKDSNLLKGMKDNPKVFGALRRSLRYYRVSGTSFSTGMWWAYWPWYRGQTITSLSNYSCLQHIDFGGHSMKNICVHPQYKNLKEEVLASGIISAKFWRMKLIEKANHYFSSSRCKKMLFEKSYTFDKGIEFETGSDFKVSLQHLQALILYTDSSQFCTALSETFRAMKPGETVEEMNVRNSMFYWVSRYLRELIYCFGFEAYQEKMPIYTGLSYQMYIPQLQIALIGPTSTTVVKEVAVRFAGKRGMLMRFAGGNLKRGHSKCFDASWISAYPEEKERVFCGSTGRETVTSIILVKSCKNYQTAVGAYAKFDAICSGQSPDKMSEIEVEIIKESLQWIECAGDSINHSNLDAFILGTFYSFVIHKKMVYLDLNNLYDAGQCLIVNLFLHPLWGQVGGSPSYSYWVNKHVQERTAIPKPLNANLIKPFVFTLFPNVHQIKIRAYQDLAKYPWQYPFDLLSFLEVLKNVTLPQSLELIMIEGRWIRREYSSDTKKEEVILEYKRCGIGMEIFWSEILLKFEHNREQ